VEPQPKKIIVTVTNDLTYDQRMIRICTSLVEAGYNVLLVGRRRGNSIPLTHQVFGQKRLSCWFQSGKLFYIEFNLRLFFFLLIKQTHAYSAVDLDTLVACTLAAKIRSKKLVFDAHEYFEEVPEVTNRLVVKKIWKTVGKWFIPHTDLAYTVNRGLAEIFTKQYHKKFEVIRSVPYPIGKIKHKPNAQNIVLYQGALNKGRGLEQLLMAMQQIDAECWIVGEGDLSGKLRHLAEDLNVKHKVKFWGYIQPDELKQITLQAKVGYSVTENIGLSYYHSLPNKFFDYIQAELPQICPPFPEFMHINQKYEVAMLCACEVSDIVNTINILLTDNVLYHKLQQACKQAKRTFNWEDEDEKLKSMYLNVI
jgi:glycosyltransferase involved in cell wall biosynthesis